MNDINWHEIFEYRDGHLYWKIKPSNKIRAGSRAGTLVSKGYIGIKYNAIPHRAHRIIWEMFNGKIPDEMQIDHINGIKIDNNISNLRLATASQNKQNQMGAYKSNKTSGIRGVSYHKLSGKWVAQIKLKGKVAHLGLFKTKEEAGEVARLKRLELFGEFAGR